MIDYSGPRCPNWRAVFVESLNKTLSPPAGKSADALMIAERIYEPIDIPVSRAAQSGVATICADLWQASRLSFQHTWLRRWAGSWQTEVEILEPLDPCARKTKGFERVRMIGGYWMVSDTVNPELSSVGRLTLGYDPVWGKFVGTWIDSWSNYLFRYDGTLEPTGRILTLFSEGPAAGAVRNLRFRDVVEFVSEDHRICTSERLDDEHCWHLVRRTRSFRKR